MYMVQGFRMANMKRNVYMGLHTHVAGKFSLNLSVISCCVSNIISGEILPWYPSKLTFKEWESSQMSPFLGVSIRHIHVFWPFLYSSFLLHLRAIFFPSTEALHKFITDRHQGNTVPLCINPQSAAFKSFARWEQERQRTRRAKQPRRFWFASLSKSFSVETPICYSMLSARETLNSIGPRIADILACFVSCLINKASYHLYHQCMHLIVVHHQWFNGAPLVVQHW